MTKKAAPKSKEPTQRRPSIVSTTSVSGGINVDADQVEVKGDVVGHDKIEAEAGAIVVGRGGRLMQVVINLPRSVQIAIGVVALAIVIVITKALIPSGSKVNTEFVFDASAAMSDPERWRIAQTVFGDQATYATRREQLALRKVGGGCDVPRDPLVPLAANQADQLVSAVKSLTPIGDAALVDSIKTAADDLPSGADTQNSIVLISAGQDTCLTKQQKDPCTAMSAVADSLNRAGIKFTLHIVALRADEAARQQLTCLARANATGYVYQADSVDDLKKVLTQIETKAVPAPVTSTQSGLNWPVAYTHEISATPLNLAWSQDGKQILVATNDHQILTWNLAANQIVAKSFNGLLQSGVWSPDRTQLAYLIGISNEILMIWDGTSRIQLASDSGDPYYARSLAWSPDGLQIAAGNTNGPVTVWNVANKSMQQFLGHSGAVEVTTWSSDGKLLASGDSEGSIRVWDTASGRSVHVFDDGCCSALQEVSGLAWSPDGKQLASSSIDGKFRILEIDTGRLIATIDTNGGRIVWSANGSYIATSNFEVVDAHSQRSLGLFPDLGPYDLGSALAWSPDGSQLAVGYINPKDNKYRYFIRVWQVPH